MKEVEKKYRCIPFWSWNDTLEPEELVKQINWMEQNGVGGFFMHARGGLKTPYLGPDWFKAIEASGKRGAELGMEVYAYDENGWPSGFAGGALLEDIENHDRYLTYSYGPADPKSLASYDLSSASLKRVTSGENCLNVYQHYSGSTADICQKEVVAKFIALTHEQYKKNDDYNLKGFFTDEPQYYRWGTSFTKALFPYFEKEYHEDILDRLGLLFVDKNGYRDFRYKYWKAMQSLMLNSYSKQIYEWCEANHYRLTGHYVEETELNGQMVCCGGIMPYYAYEHIPGVDWLARDIGNDLSPVQVASVAAQYGKKQVISEMFACSGWDVTPKELKKIAEFLYVNGVNLMCQHLLPYHEEGQRKRDYPAHYSIVNPWVEKGFKDFNDYFSFLGKTLSESTPIVDVAILQPIRSAYFGYHRDQGATGCGIAELEKSLVDLMAEMDKRHIPYHFVDETLLAKDGQVVGDALVMGKCRYHYWLFPKIYTMDKTTEALLHQFVKNGGKTLLFDAKPTYLEGIPFAYPYLKNTTSFAEIEKALPFVATPNPSVHLTYRKADDGRSFFFLVNLGEACDFSLQASKSFLDVDIVHDATHSVSGNFHLQEGESHLLYLSEKEAEAPKKEAAILHLGKEFTIVGTPENYLTLDFLSYSFDGIHYSEMLHHMGVFDELLKKRYQGPLDLRYRFNVKVLPRHCLLLVEEPTGEVKVNGTSLTAIGHSALESHLAYFDVASALKEGENEVILHQHYEQGENVYYALFGENVTESLKNCLAYDCSIEPIYLKGDFGVYGDFVPGKAANVLLGEHFYLGAAKKKIHSLISEGYPFFRGEIALEQKLQVNDPNALLEIPERFSLINVDINGTKAGQMMFTNRLDLSNVLKKGENDICLHLVVSNRNLLGPFHTLNQEDLSVGPFSFERQGSWSHGKSSCFRDSYSFVKTIL